MLSFCLSNGMGPSCFMKKIYCQKFKPVKFFNTNLLQCIRVVCMDCTPAVREQFMFVNTATTPTEKVCVV